MLRRTLLLSLALLALAPISHAIAAEDANPYANTPSFGTSYCKPTFNCSDVTNRDTARTMTDQIVSTANRCVERYMTLRNEGGFFESYGLDYNLCLTTKKLTSEKGGLTMTPRCCVKPTTKNPNQCELVCTQYGVR